MKCLPVLLFLFFFITAVFGQDGYKEVTAADFEQRDGTAIGQYTKVYFKYLPLKTTTIYDYDMGNNFFWYILMEKKGKIFLTDDLLQKGFTLTINRKLEEMNGLKVEMYALKDGKVQHAKISKKLIEREQRGDTTLYHFRFDGYTNRDICEISYDTKTEIKSNIFIVRMNEITTVPGANAELIIPQHLQFNLDLIAIDDSLSKEESISENVKIGSQYRDYKSKKTTYYRNRNLPNLPSMIVASTVSIQKP